MNSSSQTPTNDIWSVIANDLDAISLARLSQVCTLTKSAAECCRDKIRNGFNMMEYYCRIVNIMYHGQNRLIMTVLKNAPTKHPSNPKHCKKYWAVFLNGFDDHPVHPNGSTQQISKTFVVDAEEDNQLQPYESYQSASTNIVFMNKILFYFLLRGVYSLVSYLASLPIIFKENIKLETLNVEFPKDDKTKETIAKFKCHLDKVFQDINLNPCLLSGNS